MNTAGLVTMVLGAAAFITFDVTCGMGLMLLGIGFCLYGIGRAVGAR